MRAINVNGINSKPDNAEKVKIAVLDSGVDMVDGIELLCMAEILQNLKAQIKLK